MKLRVLRDPGALFSLSSPWLHEDAPGLACPRGNTWKGVENNQEKRRYCSFAQAEGSFLENSWTLL